jgi:hypothetical protein
VSKRRCVKGARRRERIEGERNESFEEGELRVGEGVGIANE